MGLATTMTVFTRKSVIDMQRRFQDVAYVSVYMRWFRIITFKISSKKGYWFPQTVPEDSGTSVWEYGNLICSLGWRNQWYAKPPTVNYPLNQGK